MAGNDLIRVCEGEGEGEGGCVQVKKENSSQVKSVFMGSSGETRRMCCVL